MSILRGQVIPSDNGEQRFVIFIPPNTIGNSHAIHGVLLDRSVSVSPYGCTLLHLTTTVNTDNDENPDEILDAAKNAILSSKCQQNEKGGGNHDNPAELYHVTFSHVVAEASEELSKSLPSGVHLCSHSGQFLTADVAFEQAQRLFATICPHMEFLGLSNTFDEAIRERAQEKRYDDDEKLMLESALGMIGKDATGTNTDPGKVAAANTETTETDNPASSESSPR
jgi:hypothetical protein